MRGTQLRILDYAAGKGRFAAALNESAGDLGKPISSLVVYHAFNDPSFWNTADERDCSRNIGSLSQDGEIKDFMWTSLAKLQCQKPFDLIVMANVLHEIPAMEWLEIMREIGKLLTSDGFLLVMEDLLPPVGELPHARGYIILDEVGLALLFESTPESILLEKRDDRLLAVAIPRDSVLKASDKTRRLSLEYIRNLAKEQIQFFRRLPATERTHQAGRQHAHYTMLYTNAHLTLDGLI
jgi:SAM-dependent methyltransferase